ncbi:selenocysteine-specific translation elongation factor [Kushneria indalinina]|uniref:Selenocysteine-specific elongation factor n=1 Tax=Kushneria indalinina DSM 14324 TaxID=1122140 RepID=A0A3D9DX61_9GAMM|nr:selenocysteine-specific translation elongation factor [Kushneria indalinina]REC95372.1 selenocysteine-specific translation elongation factor SelB [Kushneria indalinina DSM 14324]
MIVGTAGHVDHGKTALIHSLTGISTDRLQEEQARGLTIEAGYAYPELVDEFELGFIDVPGHEKFIHNMLSGVAGIDTMLLVVAADDGVMPQTREHMQILRLLGIGRGVVALTKCDLVERQRLVEVREQIQFLLAGSPLADSRIFEVSSRTGEGIAELKDELWQRAQASDIEVAQGNFRMAVDRAFTKTGSGLVVTGTVVAGDISVGDSVRLFPSSRDARVRGLRRQGRVAEHARQGDRLALNLAGPGVDRETVQRGDWVVAQALPTPSLTRVDIALELLEDAPPLSHWSGVHLHLGASHVTGRISLLEGQQLLPGQRMLAQMILETPLHACMGDRVIVRDHGARHTIGGAVVLDGAPPRRGQRSPARLQWLESCRQAVMDSSNDMPLAEPLRVALTLRQDGPDVYGLARNFNRTPASLAREFEALGARVISAGQDMRAFSPQALESLRARILEVVTDNHEREPAMLGTERERLRRQVMPGLPSALFRQIVQPLMTAGTLKQQGPFLSLPEHQAALSAEDERLWQQIEPHLSAAPFDPPRVRDLAGLENIEEAQVRQMLTSAARLGRVYHVRRDHFFLARSVHDMADMIQQLEAQQGAAHVASFRDQLGVGRKLAVLILEFFDRIGYTRRVRDDHIVRRADMWH